MAKEQRRIFHAVRSTKPAVAVGSRCMRGAWEHAAGGFGRNNPGKAITLGQAWRLEEYQERESTCHPLGFLPHCIHMSHEAQILGFFTQKYKCSSKNVVMGQGSRGAEEQ